jgi:hypothetical protein
MTLARRQPRKANALSHFDAAALSINFATAFGFDTITTCEAPLITTRRYFRFIGRKRQAAARPSADSIAARAPASVYSRSMKRERF